MVLLNGTPVGDLGAGARRQRGLAFVPEERLGRGAVPGMSLTQNCAAHGRRAGWCEGALSARAQSRLWRAVSSLASASNVRAPNAVAASLSGGNLQKFIVGREAHPGIRAC